MKRQFFSGALLLLALAGHAAAQANPDLAFTDFPNADVNALAGGQVLQMRGGLIDFQRGLTSQALYVINAPLATVQAKLSSWNPASHPELKVWMHQNLPPRPTINDFAGLQSLPDNSSVASLIDATDKFDAAVPSFQINQNESQLIASLHTPGTDPRAFFANAWSQVLLGRIGNFLGAKLALENDAVPGGAVQPLAEIKSLLRSDVKIYQRFHPLFANTPVYAANKLAPATLYYECFDIEGTAVLGTGAMYETHPNGKPAMLAAPAALDATAAPDAGTPVAPMMAAPSASPVLVADIEYFVNNGIYVSLELHQLSPVTINGQEETLVWREDLVSTANVAYLHGTERLASGMIMLQDVKQAIDAFRSEFK
jgi:hypothetical protein